jgi:LPXTG-motif cell wall-anchored protein
MDLHRNVVDKLNHHPKIATRFRNRKLTGRVRNDRRFQERKENADYRNPDWNRFGDYRFPTKVVHREPATFGSQQCTAEETISISIADFKSPVSDTVFTLAGVGLRDGQVIHFPGTKLADAPMWFQGRVDRERTIRTISDPKFEEHLRPETTAKLPIANSSSYYVALLAGVISLLLGAIAIFLRYKRNKR